MILDRIDVRRRKLNCLPLRLSQIPPAPRGVPPRAATSFSRTRATSAITSCAIRMPRVTVNGALP